MSVLSDELTNDPLGRGYAGMTDEQAAVDLNAEYRTRLRALDTRDLLRWGFGRAGLSKLRDAADKAGAYTDISDANRAKAISALTIMTAGIDGSLDPNEPEINAMLDSLVSTGIFEAQDNADLLTRATETVSRADELNIASPNTGDVHKARSI